MNEHPPKAENLTSRGSAVLTYILLTFAFSTVFYTLILIPGHLMAAGGRYVMGIMWCPAFAAFLTCHIHKIPISKLGWRWGGLRFQSASYLLPLGYSMLAYGLIWATNLGSFPNPAFIRDSVGAVGIRWMPVWASVLLIVIMQAVYGFTRSCASALGEEIGWRGFLTPSIAETRGFTSAALITGCIWSIWHYPILIFADYNLGTPWWYALPCFTIMVIGLSIIYTWFRLRTGSLWTATFLHASHNVLIQTIFTPLTGDTGPTRYAIDEFGFVLPIIIAVIAVLFWRKRDLAIDAWKEAQTDPGPPLAGSTL